MCDLLTVPGTRSSLRPSKPHFRRSRVARLSGRDRSPCSDGSFVQSDHSGGMRCRESSHLIKTYSKSNLRIICCDKILSAIWDPLSIFSMASIYDSFTQAQDGRYPKVSLLRPQLIHDSYIIENQYIHEKLVQCQLTTTCLRYLSLPCFGNDYVSTDRSQHAKTGWFAFQDYACSQWLYHIDTVIKECYELFQNPCKVTTDFASALQDFVNTHRSEITDPTHVELEKANVLRFEHLEFYDDLLLLWNHIYTHQRGDYATRNTIGIPQIETALLDNRTELERLLPNQKAGDEDLVQDYYGANLYKCRRTMCRFFYIGYEKKGPRDTHEKRHERPFQCPISCNSAPLGFVSNKDRDRHINIYHPNLAEGGPHFEVLSRRQIPGKFTCNICNKSFTRNINLKSHERSHFGDRPFACSTCGKAFARVNDCRRHEKIYARKGY